MSATWAGFSNLHININRLSCSGAFSFSRKLKHDSQSKCNLSRQLCVQSLDQNYGISCFWSPTHMQVSWKTKQGRACMGRWDVLPSVNHLNGKTNRKTKTWFCQCFRQSGGKRRVAVCCGHDSCWLTVLLFMFSDRCCEERGSFDYPWLTLVSLSAGNLKKFKTGSGLADREL